MNFLLFLLCNKDFPSLAQGTGLALLTILIPVAIAIFTDDREFKELDTQVLLDHVVNGKRVLLSAALIFIPIFFWQGFSLGLHVLVLFAWGVGLYLLVQTLLAAYDWLKGRKFPLRFAYLKGITNKNDLEEAWSAVWQSGMVNAANEAEFFDIFIDTVEKIIKKYE